MGEDGTAGQQAAVVVVVCNVPKEEEEDGRGVTGSQSRGWMSHVSSW